MMISLKNIIILLVFIIVSQFLVTFYLMEKFNCKITKDQYPEIYRNFDLATIDEIEKLSEVVPGLFISSISCMSDDILEEQNIKNTISVTKNPPKVNNDKINRMYILINDTHGENIDEYFDKAYDFIEKSLDKNEKVLVHCKIGMSRSATIIISYLMKKYNMTVDESLKYLKEKRSIIKPNSYFYRKLKLYEKKLKI